jgi:phenylacetate-CoA ligase
MNALIERIYNASPVVVQNVLLSVYGGHLRAVRYGGVHQATFQELLRTQYETLQELKALQQKRLICLIRHAYTTVPFYQEAFKKRSLTPDDIRSPEDLAKLPMVTKADLRADPERFVSSSFSKKALESLKTSGTTGTPLHLWFTRKAIQQNYAFFSRALSWAGVAPGQRSATFAGRMFIPESQRKGPYWRYNFISRNMLLSSYHLSPKTIPLYVKQLEKYAPTFIDSYPSAIYSIAQHVREAGQPCAARPTAIITSSETLLDYQREAIEETFGCRIFDQYGSAEMVVFASQCERGSLHVHSEYGYMELLNQAGHAVEPGEPGEVVSTGFLNEAMPLIRYQIGDSAVLGTEPCLCGRNFPVFKTVLGRLDDTIVTIDGRRIGRLDPIFKGARGIKETQIIQVSSERIVVKMVKGEQFVPASAQAVVQELQRRIGDEMEIDLEFVDSIERSSSGKFRTVVSLVSQGRTARRDPVQDSIKK